MIEHYALHTTGSLTDRFNLTNGLPKGVKPRFNIVPAQPAPVIVRDGESTDLAMMSWGLISEGAKDTNSVFRYKTFNTKSESVFKKTTWDTAVRRCRCIIPTNGFYMRRSDGTADDTYYFTNPNEPLMGLAGIYSSWASPDGAVISTFSMLTIESNDSMPLPFARMPVILHPEDEAAWTDTSNGDFSDIIRMMRPYEAGKLTYSKVSNDSASKKVDAQYLIESL